jgi:hypothetical protein
MKRLVRPLAWLATATLAVLALPATATPAALPGPRQVLPGTPALMWAGQSWLPRVSVKQQRPYQNYWGAGPQSAYVDAQGRLHLWIRRVAPDVWTAAQIRTLKSDYGYGTYTFVVDTSVAQMDPNAVLGMFTRNELSKSPGQQSTSSRDVGDERYVDHAETDFEIGKWNWAERGHPGRNAQYVVQPWWRPGAVKHLHIPVGMAPYTAQFVWRPHNTTFSIWRGRGTAGRPWDRWTSRFDNGTPKPGSAVLINQWLIGGRTPARNQDAEVVLDSFAYVPAS